MIICFFPTWVNQGFGNPQLTHIWVFPKIMVPPNHPFVHRVWNHYFNHPFWGVKSPYFWKLFNRKPPLQRPRRTWPNLEDLGDSLQDIRDEWTLHGAEWIFIYLLQIRSCWDIVEICWLEDFSSFLLITQMIQMDVTRLADLECKVVSSFHILWLRADHFRAATENWSNSYYFHALSIYQHNNIVELASLAQLYTITDCHPKFCVCSDQDQVAKTLHRLGRFQRNLTTREHLIFRTSCYFNHL